MAFGEYDSSDYSMDALGLDMKSKKEATPETEEEQLKVMKEDNKSKIKAIILTVLGLVILLGIILCLIFG